MSDSFELALAGVKSVVLSGPVGRVARVLGNSATVVGLSGHLALGDTVAIRVGAGAEPVIGEVIALASDQAEVLLAGRVSEVRLDRLVQRIGRAEIAPDDGWIGRVIDAFGNPLDGAPLLKGTHMRPVIAPPPPAAERRLMEGRLDSGLAAFDTFLPLVRGQRIGLFAGSGVGKSTLLAKLARHLQTDVVVLALVGERGREVREFVGKVLGPVGMKRAVVVAATSDQSALMRRRCALTAMTVAEYFRDQGLQVLFLADSVTRFAEAHREIAASAGETAQMRGFPPSVIQAITGLCERAGPGSGQSGDITAVFSVLVAGSDMDEPVADIVRGVLDGHVVLSREIAERGRYPAIDILRSVSRSLPDAASEAENALLQAARALIAAYERNEAMIHAGLYVAGSDELTDRAIAIWPALDRFITENALDGAVGSFARLAAVLGLEPPEASAPDIDSPGSAGDFAADFAVEPA